VNTFVTSLFAILAVGVAEATAIILAPSIIPLLIDLDVIGGVVATVGIVVIWYRRIPKVELVKAEKSALEYVKAKFLEADHEAKVDRTRRGELRGRKWHIFVKHRRMTVITSVVVYDVTVDAGTGKAEDATRII
jgi:hypothetical protein